MTATLELYQDIILDHNRRPRNYGVMAGADRVAEGTNPLCGDELTLYLRFDGDTIADANFTAKGCAISRASASLLTAAVKGKTRGQADELFGQVHRAVTGTVAVADAPLPGGLAAIGGVARFPARVKCASLAWHALHSALR